MIVDITRGSFTPEGSIFGYALQKTGSRIVFFEKKNEKRENRHL